MRTNGPYRKAPSQNQKPRGGYGTDWARLYARLEAVLSATGQDRRQAALKNHVDQKELICRKFGVVCEADVDRIAGQLGLARA